MAAKSNYRRDFAPYTCRQVRKSLELGTCVVCCLDPRTCDCRRSEIAAKMEAFYSYIEKGWDDFWTEPVSDRAEQERVGAEMAFEIEGRLLAEAMRDLGIS